ncbi:MAG TPA: condensation domain-containing protein, partial [Thermoanaerobaculia bacterium]|nr:condensation domain-containing protein [Thermoanaerobaculia bacterium]
LEAVSRHGGTTSGGPNFAYDLCVRKIPAEQRRSLDLSRWEVAFNGAEPVRAATLEGFAKAFADSGFRPSAFYPCYGLAEATLMVSGGRPDEPPVVRAVAADKLADGGAAAPPEGDDARTRRLVGCGAVLDGQTLAIVDPATGTRLGEGEVGEVWLSSPSVAAGYWRRPEETATTFGATLASGEGPFLRTGDLGFLAHGELFIAGRLKDLIILRGRNHYPQDLEATACESHPALIGGLAAAFCQEKAGEERLLIVQELGRRHGVDLEAVVEAIRRSVAEEHEVQVAEVVLIPAGALPRTSSGKVQRGLCRTLLLSGEMAVRARSVLDSAASDAEEVESGPAREDLLRLDDPQRLAELERWLRRRIARAVGTGPSRILSDSHLSELGFDSLMAAELKNALEEEQGISLPLAVLLDGPTLEELARVVLQRLSAPPEPQALPAAAGAGGAGETCDLPLSGMQEALWFLQRLAPEAAAYNVAFAARLPAGVDGGALGRAFRGVVRRHSALRATFSERGGRPMQRAGPPPEMLVEVGAAGWSDAVLMERLTADANRPFDLERGPALRSVLYPRSDEGPYLLLVFHHLVIDGRSLWRLLEELGERYRLEREGGAAPAPPTASYRDFVAWQEALLDGPEGKRLRELWRARVGGLAAPELPADRLRRAAPLAPRGSSWRFHIGSELTSSLRALAATRRTTLSTVLLAVFEVLLHRWTGQDEFLLGTAVWGRSRPELADVVGCLFNVVPVAVSLSSRLIFEDHLCRVQEVIRQAVDNQDYPSHRLAADLGRPPGERGLFDVMFIWQRPQWVGGSAALTHMDGRLRLNVQGLELEPLPVERRFARQELELEVIDAGEVLDAAFHYDAEIFHEATVARMARHLENLLTAAAAVPGSALEDLGLLDAEEKRQLLSDFNRADRDYSQPVSVHGLFARQAARTPAQTAAVGPRGELTYGELDARSRALADLIRTVTG